MKADTYIKGVNAKLQRLRNANLPEIAMQNVLMLQSVGFEMRLDAAGNVVVSRGKDSVNAFDQLTKNELNTLREDFIGVKKYREQQKAEKEKQEQEAEQPEEADEIQDIFTDIDDWYQLALMLQDEHNNLSTETEYMSIEDAMNLLRNGKGGQDDLSQYKELARQHIEDVKAYEAEFRQDYDELNPYYDL